jgi:hypothetical protein
MSTLPNPRLKLTGKAPIVEETLAFVFLGFN